MSVVLQIRVSDLAAQHQRLNSSQAHAEKTSATDCQIFTGAHCIGVAIHPPFCVYLQVSKRNDMLT